VEAPDRQAVLAEGFGAEIAGPRRILREFAQLGEAMTVTDLASFVEIDRVEVGRALRWAELLGLASRGAGDLWVMDPIAKAAYAKSSD